ncbi:MAG: hypothetical protein A2073_06420 [Deltaproteobacteria bacterium GWC2_42_11]|nr:MAG: hypothetical protein A2073_06420 [Deltaproteobacteria bacterium GWC2_42_11]
MVNKSVPFFCPLFPLQMSLGVRGDMIELFNEQPLLLQWLPSLDRGLVIGINRTGQVFIVISAFMCLFQDKLQVLISRSLGIVAVVIREFTAGAGWRWNKDEIGFEFPPEKPLTDEQVHEDVQIGKQFALSSILLVVLIAISGRGPLGWLLFPFEVMWRAITVWLEVQLSLWSIIDTLGGSLGRLFGFFPLLYLSILACAIIARPYAFIFSKMANYISHGLYQLAVSLVLITGLLLVLIAT